MVECIVKLFVVCGMRLLGDRIRKIMQKHIMLRCAFLLTLRSDYDLTDELKDDT